MVGGGYKVLSKNCTKWWHNLYVFWQGMTCHKYAIQVGELERGPHFLTPSRPGTSIFTTDMISGSRTVMKIIIYFCCFYFFNLLLMICFPFQFYMENLLCLLDMSATIFTIDSRSYLVPEIMLICNWLPPVLSCAMMEWCFSLALQVSVNSN